MLSAFRFIGPNPVLLNPIVYSTATYCRHLNPSRLNSASTATYPADRNGFNLSSDWTVSSNDVNSEKSGGLAQLFSCYLRIWVCGCFTIIIVIGGYSQQRDQSLLPLEYQGCAHQSRKSRPLDDSQQISYDWWWSRMCNTWINEAIISFV